MIGEKLFDEYRTQVLEGFLGYQANKYNLEGIIPLQSGFDEIIFGNVCRIGNMPLEETTYLCDANLPNIMVQNVLLEITKTPDNAWLLIMKVNFFGLSLTVHHTKEHCRYLLGIPDMYTPTFKIITKEENLWGRRRDSLI